MNKFILNSIFLLFILNSFSQQKKDTNGTFWSSTLEYKFVPSIADQLKDGTFIHADKNPEMKEIYDKRSKSNKIVPGKGLPNGMDPLVNNKNEQTYLTKQTKDRSRY